MLELIITAIGAVLFVMYAIGITVDSAVLIAAAIFIVGGMIEAKLGLLVDFLQGMYIVSDYNEGDYVEENDEDD